MVLLNLVDDYIKYLLRKIQVIISETIVCGEQWVSVAELDEALKHHKLKKQNPNSV